MDSKGKACEEGTASGGQCGETSSGSTEICSNGNGIPDKAGVSGAIAGKGEQTNIEATVCLSASSANSSTPTQHGNVDHSNNLASQPIDKFFFNRAGYDITTGNGKSTSGDETCTWAIPGKVTAPVLQTSLPFRPSTVGTSYTLPYGTAYPDMHALTSTALPTAAPSGHIPQLQFTGALPTSTATSNGTLSSAQIAARHVISRDLPLFSGKPEEWLLFISNYQQSTERCGFSNEENLIRLQKCLKGPALEAVRGKLMIPSTVPYAVGTLKMLFGRPEIVHAALQRKLRDEPAIRINNLDSVIRFALAVQNYCATLTAVMLNDYLNFPLLINELVAKMPSDLKLDWGRHSLATGDGNLADGCLMLLCAPPW